MAIENELSFTIKFDLASLPCFFSLTDTTDYASQSISTSDVKGNFKIEGPLGLIYENASWSTPDLNLGVSNVFDSVSIPVGTDNLPYPGLYTFTYTIQVSGIVQPGDYSLQTVVDYNYVRPTVNIQNENNPYIALLSSNDITQYLVNGSEPVIARIHTLIFPPEFEVPDIVSSNAYISVTTPFYLNGVYTASVESDLEYIFSNYLVHDLISGSSQIIVSDTIDIKSIYCCLKKLNQDIENNKSVNLTKYYEDVAILARATSLLDLFDKAIEFGQYTDANNYIQEIYDITGCTPGCGCGDLEQTNIQAYPTSPVAGGVTSVALSLPSSVFEISGSPVNTNGTLTGSFRTQTANTVFAAPPGGGTPSFRALVASDIPDLSSVYYLASNPAGYIAKTALSANAPLFYNNLTGLFTIQQADAAHNGYLSNTDWITFNNKFNTPAGTTSQYVRGDGSLATFPTGLPPTGAAGGDLTGTYPNPQIANVNINIGTFTKLTVNAKGQVTAATNPTTLSGYGITDAMPLTGGSFTGNVYYPFYPSSGLELVNLNYINSVLSGLKYVTSAIAATTANITISSAPGTVDGVSLTLNDRILVGSQTDEKENGVYLFNGAGNALTRTTDADSSSELNALTIFIQMGTTNGNKTFTQTTPSPVIGVDNIVFVVSNVGASYIGGTGIDVSGNIISLDTTYTDTLYVPLARTVTINGNTQALTSNISFTLDTLPSQTGNNGKYLTTNGTTPSWFDISTLYVPRIVSTDNQLVRFDGTTGAIQGSAVVVSDTTGAFTVPNTWVVTNAAGASIATGNPSITFTSPANSGTSSPFVYTAGSQTQSSGTVKAHDITTTYNQTGTAASTDISISRVETALGSGVQTFVRFFGGAAGTTEKFRIDNTGAITLATWNGVVIDYPYGGTGLSTLGSAAQFLGVNVGGTALEYKSINGTSNRISVNHAAGVSTIDISSSYVGQASITTLGTITTGTWNGTAIDATHGGTAQTVYVIGDLLQANSTTTLSRLAAVATGNALISGGVGTVSSWGKIGLTTHVSGILPIANGGTGSATQNYVDLTTNQTIAGIKTFSSLPVLPTTTPTLSGHPVVLSYLQTYVADQLAQVSINEQSISTDLTLSASSASYQEITATVGSLKVIMYSTVLNKVHCIKNMGSNTFTVVKPDTTTVLATLVAGDSVYVLTQPSSTWTVINPNPITNWVLTGSDIYNANAGGVAIGRSTVASTYKFDVNGRMLLENQTSSSYAGLDIVNNSLVGASFYVYGSAYSQSGTLDIPSTVFFGLGGINTNMWIGNGNPFTIWYGASLAETKGFTFYNDRLGIGSFAAGTDIKSNLHLKGSLSIKEPRQLASNDTISATDYMVWAVNSVSNTCTLPAISSVGYGKRFEIVASPTAGSTAPLIVTPNGTERIQYGTSSGSTYTIAIDYGSIVVTSANGGSYDYWIVS